ncbi:DUF4974 domain-containing protein [Pedobacter sp. MC2016-14]|uniref:FecR family protein n=1 Tax=Pedobacter sp. MC2016-14 TaxID=2897327 RepID=UPI001E3683E5|nr:FecR domain-containing protein [Pedobacter sp. MC2016-14]MCD0488640.1 DUF4974 domain-containing protein [Pedobacter sp. MC2016-14]
MKTTKAKELLEKYQQGLCTEEEKSIVETWYLKHRVLNPIAVSEEERLTDIYKIWDILAQKTSIEAPLEVVVKEIKGASLKLWYQIAAAASILLIIGLAIILNRPKEDRYQQLDAKSDIPAGNNRAILTLANGKKIDLSGAGKGEIAKESGISIVKLADGQVVYTVVQQNLKIQDERSYNTISTPRGGQYQVNLPDGSKIWLNAASSLKFPASFANLKERKVILSGEAYFDVFHDAKQPFRVETAGQVVEDIGTQFNINSYNDEPVVKTTLVEGSARVMPSSRQHEATRDLILMPGQQAIFDRREAIKMQNADLQEAIAWKKGDFVFRNADFRNVMRKIARWYDVEIIYDASAPLDIPLGGLVSRSKNISVLLNLMEETGAVHFKVEGRKITVSK